MAETTSTFDGVTFEASELARLHADFERAWTNIGYLYRSRAEEDVSRGRDAVARLVIASATVRKQKASTALSLALNGYSLGEAD